MYKVLLSGMAMLQAFDKVWNEGLIFKTKKLYPVRFMEFLESVLLERKFGVKDKFFTSLEQNIQAGVPQGSVLGPKFWSLNNEGKSYWLSHYTPNLLSFA